MKACDGQHRWSRVTATRKSILNLQLCCSTNKSWNRWKQAGIWTQPWLLSVRVREKRTLNLGFEWGTKVFQGQETPQTGNSIGRSVFYNPPDNTIYSPNFSTISLGKAFLFLEKSSAGSPWEVNSEPESSDLCWLEGVAIVEFKPTGLSWHLLDLWAVMWSVSHTWFNMPHLLLPRV